MKARWGVVVWLVACSGRAEPVPEPPGTDPPTLPDPPTDTGGLQPCAAPLVIDPAAVSVGPLDLVQLTATGGTGAHRFVLAEPAHGSVHPLNGSYLAPDEPGVTDTVVLTDEGCVGQAAATIDVGDPFGVLPFAATVLPLTTFDLQISGGSGSWACSVVSAQSGSVDAGCRYTAGATQGLDRLRAHDLITGDSVDVTVTVDPDARLDLWGTERWVLPLGSTFVPRASGGSEIHDITVLSGPLTSTGPGVRADAVGTGRARLQDRFAGFVHEVDVEVVAPYVPDSPWVGQRSLQGQALGPGDLNGDGHPDAVLAFLETNGLAWYSGAVMVYAGTATGLDPVPAFVALGTSAEEYLGRSLAVADVDGDGLQDLLAGADGGDLGSANVGVVRIWRGVPGGFFEDEPGIVLRGVYGSDRAGSALAVCDFDGDGYTDVAVGAYAHEERTDESYPTDTGAVLLFRGGPGGLPDDPSVIRYGRRISGSDWITQSSTRLGYLGMAAGDMDGDGRCELALASFDEGVLGQFDSYGWAAVYQGLDSAEGTLSAEAVRVYANLTDTNANLGRSVAMGDLDGDGLSDLVVGAYGWDGPAGSSAGGAFVFLASSVDGRAPTDVYTPDDADWTITGTGSSNYLGLHVVVSDVDGDGLADLTTGEPRGELPNGDSNVGRVRVWSGATVASGGDAPLVDVGGAEVEGYFGQAAAPVGDLDGDGLVDLVVLAGRTDGPGLDVGSAHLAFGSGALADLELPGEPAGHEHGRAVALYDADADGSLDLVVGSPQDGDLVLGGFTGSVTTFSGLGNGAFDPVGARFGGAHVDHGSSDRRGQALAGGSDFDGDGWLDLAVVARADSKPDPFDPGTYANPDECPGSISSAGSVVVHRGGPGGVDPDPAFVFYGVDSSANIRVAASGLDFDGDGFDDLVVGGRDWAAEGGVGVLRGRPADPGGRFVLCGEDTWIGLASGDWFGASVAALGDLDGDGCDEIVVGAPREDTELSNQGVVRVFWGCDRGVTALAPGIANSQAGDSVAGGGDLDGDGVPDLVVGGTEVRVGSSELGGAWLVPGSWLLQQPRRALGDLELEPLVPQDVAAGLLGPTPSARFGAAVAIVGDALAVGLPDGDEGGVDFAGGVHLYRYDPALPGLEAFPFLVVGGETHAPGGQLGDALSAGRIEGYDVLLVGAPASSLQGLKLGGAYVVPLR